MTVSVGLGGFLTRVRQSLAPDNRSDAELLRDYDTTHNDAAFTELVRRFAPMVWGVCRRTVGHHQLAEDAFQAVFLVLIRKSNAIRPSSTLGGWLHSVAFHTSLRARAMAKLRRHDSLDTDEPATSDPVEPTVPNWLRILDEEIAKLPVKLRSAVALCELDGLSRTVAATRLGIAEGTVSSRLAAARKQLAERLRARGVTLGIGGVAATFITSAGAAPAVASVANATVSTLVEGAIRTMFLIKLKLVSAGVLAFALVGVGLTSFASDAGERKSEAPVVRRNAPVPKVEAKEGKLLVWIGDKPLLLKPDGTVVASPDEILGVSLRVYRSGKLSPDGQFVAYTGISGEGKNGNSEYGLRILTLDGKVKHRVLDRIQAFVTVHPMHNLGAAVPSLWAAMLLLRNSRALRFCSLSV